MNSTEQKEKAPGLAKPLLGFYLLILGAMFLVGLVGSILGAVGKLGSDWPPAWAFVIVLGFALFTAYIWLRYPFEIKIGDDSIVEFRSLIRRTTISPMDIRSVRARRYALGLVDVAHQRGTVHLLNQMDGFHDFLATLKSLNPTVEIKGC